MEETAKYPPHPAAKAFPLMEGDAYDRHREDVRENGLRLPIILAKYDAQWTILDGRNRQRACDETGVEPRYEHFKSEDVDDQIAYAVSVNVSRRHLNDTQRAYVATKLANIKHGGPRASGKSAGCSQAQAASLMNVSERTVRDAKAAAERGIPEIETAMASGELAASRAVEISKLSDEQQRDELAQLKAQPRQRATPEQKDRWMSREVRLEESDVRGLQALIDYAEDGGPPLVQVGIRVLRRLAPQVNREG